MRTSRRRLSALAAVLTIAVCGAGAAGAATRISPPRVFANESQLFSLVVEPEPGEDDAVLAMVELYPPPDFRIDSFAPAEGWERDWTIQSGKTLIQKAVWTREEEPEGEEEIEEATEQDAVFQFVGRPEANKTYAFEVRQWYSDGSVIHRRGAESVAFPPNPRSVSSQPPTTLVATSLDEPGGSGKTLAAVALVVAALGLVTAAIALFRIRGLRAP